MERINIILMVIGEYIKNIDDNDNDNDEDDDDMN